MMKVNSGHHSGHPNRNIRYYDSEGNDDDIGEGGVPILGELSYEKLPQIGSPSSPLSSSFPSLS